MRCLGLFLFLSVLSITQKIYAQDSIYFNNIYQHQNNFAWGMTILETDDGYVGYAGTEDPSNIGQMLLFFKIDHEGDEVLWKPFGENYHDYYFGNVGGAMIKTYDNNFVIACHYADAEFAYATLIKLNENLDTIWKRNFHTNEYTIGINTRETSDHGFIITGWVWDAGPDLDVLLLKTDSNGIYQWHQTYGGTLVEQGETVIQTPDGGYLIGGFRYNPAIYHTLDALVIKTDSLGNEEWTKTFGNPNVEDDMAFVALADDGNYLVATVYGEWKFGNDYRIGKQCIYKINPQGQTIEFLFTGISRLANHIRNMRNINDSYILTGFSYETDSITYQYYSGWMMKLDNNLDSLWYRDYYYSNNESDQNLLYDMFPCQDKGYIGAGFAWPDIPGTHEKLWIIKVDSMGCDTAGCATGTYIYELPVKEKQELVRIYPNPASSWINLIVQDGLPIKEVIICNQLGQRIREEKLLNNMMDISKLKPGIYFIEVATAEWRGRTKLVKE